MTLTRSGSEIADYFAEALQSLLGQEEFGPVPASGIRELNGQPYRPRFNVAPSQDVLTVVGAAIDADLGARFAWKRWGLVPSWAKDTKIGNRLFNARSETAHEKPSFRAAWKRRRCLVVADGFYEWTPRNRDHQPFHFRPVEASLLGFAGLYETWRGEGGEVVESCTVLTTEASEDLEGVHHRMPVILKAPDYSAWLDPATQAERLKALVRPGPGGVLDRTAVGRHVNNPRRDDASCLEPASSTRAVEERVTGKGGEEASGQAELFGPPDKRKPLD